MALSDKDIVITPNKGQTSDPKIVFSGADATTGAKNITLRVYPTNNGTVSLEGSVGQLLSVSNTMSGSIFSVNDISGIPSIDVDDTGVVKIAPYNGSLTIGSSTAGTYKFNIYDQNNNGFGMYQSNDSDGALFRTHRTKGTLAAPTAVTTDTNLAGIRTFGLNSSGTYNPMSASIDFYAAENFTSTAGGSYIALRTTAIGTVGSSERFRIGPDGVVTTYNGIFTVGGTYAAPNATGTTDNSAIALLTSGHGEMMRLGSAAGYNWIQSSSQTNLATNYELKLNPNGGLVSVGSGGLLVNGSFTQTLNQDTLTYHDFYNTSNTASAGVITRFITYNADGTAVTTLDMVKYKTGAFVIANNDASASSAIHLNVSGVNRLTINNAVRIPSSTLLCIADDNHGMIYNAGVDGPQFRGFAGFTWNTGASGATQIAKLTATSGLYMVGARWFRNDTSGYGLFNDATGAHFYSSGNGNFNLTGNVSTNAQLVLRHSYGGAATGYLYSDGSGFGFLARNAAWSILIPGDAAGGGALTGPWTAGKMTIAGAPVIGNLNVQVASADSTAPDFAAGIVLTEGTWSLAGISAFGTSGFAGNLSFGVDPSGTSATNIVEKLRIQQDGDLVVRNRLHCRHLEGKEWDNMATTGNLYLNYNQTAPVYLGYQGKLWVDSNGKLIFTNATTTNDHIQLYGSGVAAGYGFGVESDTLYYRSGANHRFYAGTLANGGTSGVVFVTNASGAQVYGPSLTVGSSTSSNIYMSDSDEGNRTIHCNSQRIGFLTQAAAWGSWCEDDGAWGTIGYLSASSGLSKYGASLSAAPSTVATNWYRILTMSGSNQPMDAEIYIRANGLHTGTRIKVGKGTGYYRCEAYTDGRYAYNASIKRVRIVNMGVNQPVYVDVQFGENATHSYDISVDTRGSTGEISLNALVDQGSTATGHVYEVWGYQHTWGSNEFGQNIRFGDDGEVQLIKTSYVGLANWYGNAGSGMTGNGAWSTLKVRNYGNVDVGIGLYGNGNAWAGTVYADGGGNIGFLNSASAWALKFRYSDNYLSVGWLGASYIEAATYRTNQGDQTPSASFPGVGIRPFYHWGGVNTAGSFPNDTTAYCNGISIGAHPGDPNYGFQFVNNMWDDDIYHRTYHTGAWQGYKRIVSMNTSKAADIRGAFPVTGYGNATAGVEDRPSLRVSGSYPEIVVMAGGAGNGNHGGTISIGSYDSGTSGAVKMWVLGTNGTGSTWLDIGYGTSTNPHLNGVGGYGATALRMSSDGVAFDFKKHHGASNNTNVRFTNMLSNHSYGLVAEFRTQGTGSDRPSIAFSSASASTTWSVGYVTGTDDDFRITKNHGVTVSAANAWGTEQFRISTAGVTYLAGGNAIMSANGDIRTQRNGGTTGVYYFGTGDKYFYYDGTDFNLQGGKLLIASNNLRLAGAARQLKSDGTNTGFTDGVDNLCAYVDGANSFVVTNTLWISGNPHIYNGSPTIYLRDTDARSCMIHNQNSHLYLFRGTGNGSDGWTAYNGYWPADWNLDNNDVTFGGNVTAVYNVTAYSDERLKKDWVDIPENIVEKLAKVKNGTYTRIDISEQRQIGVSAQSLREVLPEAVTEADNEEKTLSVAYGNAALAMCVELAKEIVLLKEEINRLKGAK